MAAAYATGGTGKYKNEILWLTWGDASNPLGKGGVSLKNGDTSTASIPVANGATLAVSCSIGNISTPSGKPLKSYRPGDWRGDTLDDAYNVSGAGSSNQLINGIVGDSGISSFTVNCSSMLNNRNIGLRGFVIADAESMAAGNEYIMGAASGKWSVIEKIGTSNTAYFVDKSTQAEGVLPNSRPGDSFIKFRTTSGDGDRGVLTFLQFADSINQSLSSQQMAFQVKGGGKTAIAIGVLVPFADFGDAPESYGSAMHLIADINFSSDGIGATEVDAMKATPSVLNPPKTIYLGSTGPDSEPQSQFSANAEGDDGSGQSAQPGTLFYKVEEDAIAPKTTISVLESGQPYTMNLRCNASGVFKNTVAGWIDFNQNGIFDESERSLGTCSGTQASLSWTLPFDLKPGHTFVRLRIGSDSQQVSSPTMISDDGEVEDHRIQIIAPELNIQKTHNASPGWTIAQPDAKYTLTVSNVGLTPTGPAKSGAGWKPIQVLDQMPLGIVPAWTGILNRNEWACTYSGQLVTCITSKDLGEKGSATAVSRIELPVEVKPSAAYGNSLVNYASVAGGMDPYNGGVPPAPETCSNNPHCASAVVPILDPGVSVSKSANPAAGQSVKAGDKIVYTLSVTVRDSETFSPVVLTDVLGAGLEYKRMVSNKGGFTEGGSGLSRTFTLPTGKKPGQYSLQYEAEVLKNAKVSVKNNVIPSGGGDPANPNAKDPSCNASCSTEHVLMPPVVKVEKSSNPASGNEVNVGDIITYTLETTVENSPLEASLTLDDLLGESLEFGAVVSNNGYSVSGAGKSHQFTLALGTVPGIYRVIYTASVKNNDAAVKVDLKNVVTPKYDPNSGITNPPCGVCVTDHQYSSPKIIYSKTTKAVAAKDGEEILYEITVEVENSSTKDTIELNDNFLQGVKFSRIEDIGEFDQISANKNDVLVKFSLSPGKRPGVYKLSYWGVVDQNLKDPGSSAATPVTEAKNDLLIKTSDKTVCGNNGCKTTTPIIPSKIFYSKKIDSQNPTKAVAYKDRLKFQVLIKVEDSPTPSAYVLKDTLDIGLRKTEKAPVTSPSSGITANWETNEILKINLPAGLSVGDHLVEYEAEVTDVADEFVRNSVVPEPRPSAGTDGPRCASYCATETPVAKPEVSFTKTSSVTTAKVGEVIPYELTVYVKKASLKEDVDLMVDNLSLGLELDGASLSFDSPLISGQKNGQSLVLKVKAGILPGTYSIKYSAVVTDAALSFVNNKVEGLPTPDGNLPKCDASSLNGCSVKTEVERTIQPEDDDFGTVKSSTGSSNVGNAYDNDKINGNPVTLDKITGKVITPAAPVNGGTVPVLDVNTGVVSVPPGTPAGTYQIVYQICDKLVADPALGCKTATITVKVTSSPIDAKDDSYTGNRGSGDQEVGNAYSENDTLDGVPFSPDRITGTVTTPAQPIGGDPRVPVLDVVTGKVTVPSGTPVGDYTIHYRICERLNPNNCDDAVIKVTVKPDESLLRIVKTAAVRTAKIGDLVRYSLQIQNIGAVKVVNAKVVDTAANGFTFVNGSMSAVGLGSAVTSSGVRPVQFSGVTLDVGQTGTITYMMRVGAGVRPGKQVNTAFARNNVGDGISNQATASVELVNDPLMDDSLIFGMVFDDRDRDGWQDSAKLTGLKAQGGFAPAAYVPNSTTVDKGQGAEPAADASSPLLHGMDLGEVAARQSEADPVAKHTVVIHQKLKSLDFTDDFVLTNDQGVTVRMNAAGQTQVEKVGEAAAGRNAAEIEVERKISQTPEGYGVDYIIRSTGIDERGIPGVRVASVEGLLMETDPFGRYHLVGINGGRWERGRHFILKVDPSTLPAGAEFTTSNPLLRRVTPGLPVRFDFGVQLNPEFMAGEQKAVEIELGSVLFTAGSSEIRSQYLTEDGVLAQVAAKVQQYQGGELLVSANGEDEALAFSRAEAVRKAIAAKLPPEVQAATKVSVRADVNDAASLVSGVTADGAVLGNVLFETDKAVVRAEFKPLLQKVAVYLNEQGSGVVSIVGHTDVRASHAYNQKLGLARAKAVFEALQPHLSEELKQALQVQVLESATPANRSNKKAKSY